MDKNLFSEPIPVESTLVDLLCKRALQQQTKVAYTFLVDGETQEVSLTYEALDQKARSLAALLQSMKAIGERVLLLYPPGLEYIAAFFGCLYAGVTAVPLYPPRPNQRMTRLQAIAQDAQATFVLTTKSIANNLAQSCKEQPELAALQCITTDDLTDDYADKWLKPEITSNSLALLQYTSGSTGTPKGVMVSHGNLLHNSQLIQRCFEHTPESKGVIWLPPYHDMGLIGGVIQPLYSGFPVILMSPETFLQKPFRWLKAISRYKATTSGGPNFAYDLCIDKITSEELSLLDLSNWEVAFTGAEPVRAETINQFSTIFKACGFQKNAFYPCYGMAETTLIASGGLKADLPVVQFVKEEIFGQNLVKTTTEQQKNTKAVVSVGRSCFEQKIAIANPETFTKYPDGHIGEIWVTGPSIARGYWRKPQETQQTFNVYLKDTKEGPFLRTGDLGFLLDGELFVTGRIKDMIIIRGQNYYPQDIELTVQKSHSALRLNYGAAFSVEVQSVERLVIVQEVERSYIRQLDIDEIVKAIRQAVSQEYQLQVYAVVLLKTASIPKTSSGKIQRYACRDGFINGSLNVVGHWIVSVQQVASFGEQVQDSDESQPNQESKEPAFTEEAFTEEAIATWLVSHLALSLEVSPDEIDIQEPFAAYGLDSSVAVSMTGELAQWLGCELEPTLFWEYPNIEMLAEFLAVEYQSVSSSNSLVGV
ncbi:beta-ketoacyl synthase [Nostoc sp. NIES-4103]|nr:beta-ketoacyl synthase [Nostoc sp. NIES-4103]